MEANRAHAEEIRRNRQQPQGQRQQGEFITNLLTVCRFGANGNNFLPCDDIDHSITLIKRLITLRG